MGIYHFDIIVYSIDLRSF